MIDFQSFVDWKNEKESRVVDIDIERNGNIKVWVYDHDLATGQFVQTIEEIGLEAKMKQELAEKIAKWQALEGAQ